MQTFYYRRAMVEVLWVTFTSILLGVSITHAQFSSEPESVVQAEGLEAVFECLLPGASSHGWFVNGVNQSSSEFPSEFTVSRGTSGDPSLLTIPASSQFNNSVVQCAGLTLSGAVPSIIVTLTVERVAIDVVNGADGIIISVTNNFTTNLTYQLDVTLDNITVETVLNISNPFEFQYPNRSFCDVFSFTVTPTTMEMKGTSSEPVTGFFTRALGHGGRTVVSENGANKCVAFTFAVLNCTTFTWFKVVANIQTLINESITHESLFNGLLVFPLPTDQRGEYTITLTDENSYELVFENFPITTFDVQKVFIFDSPKVGAKISIEYAQDTQSPGAFVCVLPRTNDGLDFSQMKLVTIPRNASNNFSIPLPEGEYSFVVFDLENENGSIPRMPMSRAAVINNRTITSGITGTPSLPPSNEGITVTVLSNQDVQVTCPQSLNCLVLVLNQSLASLEKAYFGFIHSCAVSTIGPVGNVDNDTYVVVYSWGEDESIFEGTLSHIERLNLITSTSTRSSTSDPPICSVPGHESPAGISSGAIVFITLLIAILI